MGAVVSDCFEMDFDYSDDSEESEGESDDSFEEDFAILINGEQACDVIASSWDWHAWAAHMFLVYV